MALMPDLHVQLIFPIPPKGSSQGRHMMFPAPGILLNDLGIFNNKARIFVIWHRCTLCQQS
jgi:hypothetical protein